MKLFHSLFLFILVFAGCTAQAPSAPAEPSVTPAQLQTQADTFLKKFNAEFQKLYYETSKAEWLANTDVKEENDKKLVEAEKNMSHYVGSKGVIDTTRHFLARKKDLTDLQVRQLDSIWSLASHYPSAIKDTVDELIAAEAKQSNNLYSFEFRANLNGKDSTLTPNDIDRILNESKDPLERQKIWEASKEVGKVLKDGLDNLKNLRNKVARAMGHSSFYGLEVSNYGMTAKEMTELMDKVLEELHPLYRELHTYARYELATRYGQAVPEYLPAHWLANRWGQNWPGLVQAVDLNPLFKNKSPEWIVKQAEQFYVSMGFPKLPNVFWEKSDLYQLPKDATRKKNTHASAWHLDIDQDLRSLMSVESNMDWFGTTHHELGHIYYFQAYSKPEIPVMLREGANRAFHEGVGTLIGMAAGQAAYLKEIGLLAKDAQVDKISWLLDQAMEHVVFMPWGAGTMTRFEYELYEQDLPKDQFNKRWWEIVKKYQGIVPPTDRGNEFADAASKTHINDDPAQYYDYAISELILFQLHEHICSNILKQHPSDCNYYGSKETGAYLKSILELGSTRDWRAVLKEKTGSDLSAKAMLRYFEPLMEYLKKVNAGRKHTI